MAPKGFPLPSPSGSAGPDWQWPVRIAVLEDPSDGALRYAIDRIARDIAWFGELAEVVDPSTGHTVDLLLIGGALDSAVERLDSLSQPVHANAVGIIGAQSVARVPEPVVDRLIQLAGALAVFIAIPRSMDEWLHQLLRSLSHDQRFHEALAEADQCDKGGTSVLWSSEMFLESCRISKTVDSIFEMDRTTLVGRTTTLSPEVATKLFLPSGEIPLSDVVEAFLDKIGSIGFGAETRGALVTVGVQKALRAGGLEASPGLVGNRKFGGPKGSRFDRFELEASPPPPPSMAAPRPSPMAGAKPAAKSPRSLQCDVQVAGKHVDSFLAGSEHTIQIVIAPDGFKPVALAQVFPEGQLPASKKGHDLTVVFFAEGLMDVPAVGSLFLPKVGPSKPCEFPLFVPQGTALVDASVSIAHAGRVLQTAKLRGAVRLAPARTSGTTNPTYFLEGIRQVQTASQDLDKRLPFQQAFVVDSSATEVATTSLVGDKAVFARLSATDIDKARDQFNTVMGSGEWDLDEFKGLQADGTTRLLNQLARFGRSLYQQMKLFEVDKLTAVDGKTKGPRHIQIVSATPSDLLPFEYIYDRPVPEKTARVCGKAKAALRAGTCAGCPEIESNPSPVICPLGFWCTQHVIEWHAFSESKVHDTQGAPFRLDSADDAYSGTLAVFRNTLVGHSSKVVEVDPDSLKPLRDAIAAVTGKTPMVLLDWKDWKKQVKAQKPTLEVLLVHTEADPPDVDLELGDKNMLPILALDDAVRAPDGPRPLVLLLGCSTGTAKVSFQSVAAAFQRSEAAIVVSTTADVFGPIAAQLAQLFVTRLGSLSGAQSFGDVMLDVRRKALAKGNPMVMCLRAYGDADWRLEQ